MTACGQALKINLCWKEDFYWHNESNLLPSTTGIFMRLGLEQMFDSLLDLLLFS
jgi:hypothetical protein